MIRAARDAATDPFYNCGRCLRSKLPGDVASAPLFGFRGELHLGTQVHLRARDLIPDLARFNTPDPLDGVNGTPTVASLYAYANNDPVNLTDPQGLRPDIDAYLGETVRFSMDPASCSGQLTRDPDETLRCTNGPGGLISPKLLAKVVVVIIVLGVTVVCVFATAGVCAIGGSATLGSLPGVLALGAGGGVAANAIDGEDRSLSGYTYSRWKGRYGTRSRWVFRQLGLRNSRGGGHIRDLRRSYRCCARVTLIP